MLHMSQAFRLRTGNSKRRLLWLEAFGRQDLFGCWRGQECDQCLGRIDLFAAGNDPQRIRCVALDFGRQRDGDETGNDHSIARQSDSDLALAPRHGLGDLGTGRKQLGLRFEVRPRRCIKPAV